MTKRRLRSQDWFDNPDHADMTALYLERFMNYGLTPEELTEGRPIIGIAQSGSDLAPCNRHHIDLAKRVRDGIRDAGGIPIEFPTHPVFENCRRPTAALDRNLAYLGLVEVLHGYPIDGVVLTTGCDKTTPAAIMAAATVDIPAIVLSGGAMLDSVHEGRLAGSGTVIWQSRRRYAAGEIDRAEFLEAALESAPSIGHCNTMGTASTMNALAEAMGLSLTGCAAIPAAYRERGQMAYRTGRRAVELVTEDLRPSQILTRDALLNAVRVNAAIGGSTNAQPHLAAIAEAAGVELTRQDWQIHGYDIPLLADVQPAGRFLSERFHRAGGGPGDHVGTGRGRGAGHRLRDRHRAQHRREPGRARGDGPRGDPPLGRAADGTGGLPRPDRQPLRLRHHEDLRDLRGLPSPLPVGTRARKPVRGPGGGLRRVRGLPRPDQRSGARGR
jgi:dihydroxyacid dehydratase/phosphogluconate dehydratase